MSCRDILHIYILYLCTEENRSMMMDFENNTGAMALR